MRPRRTVRLDPPWRFPLRMALFAAAFALLGALTSLIVFGVLQGRDDGRYDRGRTDIQQLRQQADQIESELAALQANLTAITEPIGFSATKLGSQSVGIFFLVTVTGWSTAVGRPAYDATGGGFNNVTGVFTASVAAKYQVDASICWDAGGSGSRVAAITNSALGLMNSFGTNFYGGVGGTCNVMTVVYDLEPGDRVWLVAGHSTFALQTINVFTKFAIERIADE